MNVTDRATRNPHATHQLMSVLAVVFSIAGVLLALEAPRLIERFASHTWKPRFWFPGMYVMKYGLLLVPVFFLTGGAAGFGFVRRPDWPIGSWAFFGALAGLSVWGLLAVAFVIAAWRS